MKIILSKYKLALVAGIVLALSACGGGKGGGGESAAITGNIQNDTAIAWMPSWMPDFFVKAVHAATNPFDAVFSDLKGLDAPERLSVLTGADFAMATVDVHNTGSTTITGSTYEIQIEHAAYITKEDWSCLKCYSDGNGSEYCNQIWQVDGGDILNPVTPAPAQPQCDTVNETIANGYCLDTFPAGIDCANNITWRIEYQPPGDGLFKTSGNIPDLAPGERYTTSHGITMNQAENIRPDHYGRWKVKRADQTEMARKEYVFDVQ